MRTIDLLRGAAAIAAVFVLLIALQRLTCFMEVGGLEACQAGRPVFVPLAVVGTLGLAFASGRIGPRR